MNAALDDDIAPMIGQVRVESADTGDGGMEVTIDAAWFDDGHAGYFQGGYFGKDSWV
jgi:hypothetical protein